MGGYLDRMIAQEATAGSLRSPQLAALAVELDAATKEARAMVDGLDRPALLHASEPGRWSAAQCLLHLARSADAYDASIGASIANARRAGRTGYGPFRADLIGRLLAWSLEPPSRVKSKTTAPLDPGDVTATEIVLPTFLGAQERLRARLCEADGVALDQIKVTSAFNARIRYNLLSYFRLTMAHERRHLWQATQALAAAGASPRPA
jgi:hypothetical protein